MSPLVVQRDGFESCDGNFYALTRTCSPSGGRIRRYSLNELSRLFLPTMTPEGQNIIRWESGGFVRAQLQHYGVKYDKSEFKYNGVNLLKKALAAGQFDSVPAHILELEQQMRKEWARGQALDEIAYVLPNELVNCYFLDTAGRPDETIMPNGLAAPVSDYSVDELAVAIGKVPGLKSKREGDMMLIAWNEASFAKAREAGHAAARQAEEARKQEEQKRKQSRIKLHERYLRTLDSKTREVDLSPVGRYLLRCKSIEDEWPDTEDVDMTLSISTSQERESTELRSMSVSLKDQ